MVALTETEFTAHDHPKGERERERAPPPTTPAAMRALHASLTKPSMGPLTRDLSEPAAPRVRCRRPCPVAIPRHESICEFSTLLPTGPRHLRHTGHERSGFGFFESDFENKEGREFDDLPLAAADFDEERLERVPFEEVEVPFVLKNASKSSKGIEALRFRCGTVR